MAYLGLPVGQVNSQINDISMTRQDSFILRTWTETTILKPCDWIQCLRPPDPPPSANLRITGWDGLPIEFGGAAEYVCRRGYKFEVKPLLNKINFY